MNLRKSPKTNFKQQGQTIPTYPNYHPRACWKSSISFFSSWYAGLKEHCWQLWTCFWFYIWNLSYTTTVDPLVFSPGSDHSLSWGGIFLQRDLDRNQSFPRTSNLFQLRATRELIRLARETSKKKRKIQRWIRCWYIYMYMYNQPDPVWRNMKFYSLICLSSLIIYVNFLYIGCVGNCCYVLKAQISSIMAHPSRFTLHYLPLSSCSPSEPVPPNFLHPILLRKIQLTNFWGSPTSTHK